MTAERELTFGEKAAGVGFNVSNDTDVDQLKRHAANYIDYINTLRQAAADTGQHQKARMYSLAITDVQTAQMWAVKAVTWRHPE